MKHIFAIATLFISIHLFAQDKPKWDVNNPPGNSKEVSITTNEEGRVAGIRTSITYLSHNKLSLTQKK